MSRPRARGLGARVPLRIAPRGVKSRAELSASTNDEFSLLRTPVANRHVSFALREVEHARRRRDGQIDPGRIANETRKVREKQLRAEPVRRRQAHRRAWRAFGPGELRVQ